MSAPEVDLCEALGLEVPVAWNDALALVRMGRSDLGLAEARADRLFRRVTELEGIADIATRAEARAEKLRQGSEQLREELAAVQLQQEQVRKELAAVQVEQELAKAITRVASSPTEVPEDQANLLELYRKAEAKTRPIASIIADRQQRGSLLRLAAYAPVLAAIAVASVGAALLLAWILMVAESYILSQKNRELTESVERVGRVADALADAKANAELLTQEICGAMAVGDMTIMPARATREYLRCKAAIGRQQAGPGFRLDKPEQHLLDVLEQAHAQGWLAKGWVSDAQLRERARATAARLVEKAKP